MADDLNLRPVVLHIGDPIKYNHELYAQFSSQFNVVRPSVEERQRPVFLQALREQKWGSFAAILRPFWNTGGEMGQWDRELIEALPETVQVFASAGAGFDWADVDVFAEHGILYCNSATASAEAVADFALYGILSVFRQLNWCTTAASCLNPAAFLDCHNNATALSHNPRGHTLGIIGLGNIGYHIAKKAFAAFGMKIIYHDVVRKRQEQEAEIHADYFDKLEDMLSESDCVVLATPSSSDGSRLITKLMLSKFKKGSRFINIARGSLVDESAMADALESGYISAAFLDVHFDEPNVSSRLASMRNVTLTCHNAGGTVDTHIGFERLSMENIESVLTGNGPVSAVNAHLFRP